MIPQVVVDFASLNFPSIIPMLIIIGGALIILIIDLIKPELDKSLYTMLSVVFIAIDLIALLNYQGAVSGFFDLILLDGIAILSQIIILVSSGLFIILSLTHQRFHEYRYPEFFALFLFMIAGFQFMVSTDNLILIFVGLETASLAMYTLIALHNRAKSFESAIKYFTMGALGAAFYVFGVMTLYAATGAVEMSAIAQTLVANDFSPLPYIIVAVVFLLGAFAFKLSLVPSHTWAPDVYEGASSALAGYLAIVPKLAGFVVAMRIFEIFVWSEVVWVQNILWIIVVTTMTVANVIALTQKDVKRMLAYSSVSHAGFAMAAILIGTTQANTALFLYWTLFMFTNIGAFTMLWVNRHKVTLGKTHFDHPYEKFQGMVYNMPIAASVMALFMISLAGVPPFSVFWGKMYMLSSAVNSGYIILAIIMALNSAIAAFYYLKLVVFMFLKAPVDHDTTNYMNNASLSLKTILGISAAVTLLSVFFVNPMMELFTAYVAVSGF
jgi:NADH-quinone oxidoreductase subunit N